MTFRQTFGGLKKSILVVYGEMFVSKKYVSDEHKTCVFLWILNVSEKKKTCSIIRKGSLQSGPHHQLSVTPYFRPFTGGP